MNSAINIITTEMSPANDSKTLPKKDSDDNANLNFNCTRAQCTGAIPKTKPIIKPNSSHSNNCIKVNNNIDKIPAKKCPTSCSEEMCQSFPDNAKNNDVSKPNTNNSFALRPSCSRISTTQCCLEVNKSAEVPLPQNNLPCDSSSSQEKKCLIFPYALNNEAASNSVKQNNHSESDSNSDSDTANEDAISIFDDGCIYTYKGGDHVNELSSPFLNLEASPPIINGASAQKRPSNRSCSPEMDYLEMDFDPGQPCDEDSDLESSIAEIKNNCAQPEIKPTLMSTKEHTPPRSPLPDPSFSGLTSEVANMRQSHNEMFHACETEMKNATASTSGATSSKISTHYDDRLSQPGPSGLQQLVKPKSEARTSPGPVLLQENDLHLQPLPSTSRDASIFTTPRAPTTSIPFAACRFHQGSNGNLLSPSTAASKPTSPTNGPLTTEILRTFQSSPEEQPSEHLNQLFEPLKEDVMLWSEEQAALRQTMQVAPSACGATAVINVLSAFDMKIPATEKVVEAVCTRKRAKGASMVHYLLSRSFAGSTHEDLIKGLETLSEGRLYARFFHMYPERSFDLNNWLSNWIKKGVVPIATMNLQRGLLPDGDIPDAWHHQMIHGVGPNGVYLTNPMECKDTALLWHQLSSESILLIRRADVLEHWTENTNIRDLMQIKEQRWRRINVVGQVANMVRESRRPQNQAGAVTQHIRMPASYSAGITLVARKDSPEYHSLRQACELSLMQPSFNQY